ncbi:MAG: HAMP domain-containing protein [Pirellulaceae bacterium]|nr:HAMP domain-containing protein [Pirellulaceae bacterium]
MTQLGNLRIKSLGTAISGLLLVVAVLVAVFSYLIVRQVDQIGHTWESFDTGTAAKADILSSLRDALGYGGVIHQFKNFVLRKDRLRLITIQKKLFDISFALNAYRNLGIGEREQNAIAQIHATLSKYAKAVGIAERMAASGASSQDIDKVVTIDDRPALDAFTVLHEVHLEERRASALSVYQTVNLVKEFAPSGSLVIGGLLVILVVSFLWFTRSRLVKPLARLENAMQILASGDTDIDIPAIARRDELGTMARTVLVFKENAVQRKRAETDLLAAKEQAEEANRSKSDFLASMSPPYSSNP